jgi:hypothetical protein
MNKSHLLAAGIAMASLLAACGSASSTDGGANVPSATSATANTQAPASAPPATVAATPTPTPQQQFVLLVDYLNSGLVVFQSATSGSGLTPAQLAAAAGPLGSEFKTFDQGLSNYAWPANTASDVKTLLHLDQAVEQDLATAAAGSVTASGLSSWINHENSDYNLVQAQAKIVRADLGLGVS